MKVATFDAVNQQFDKRSERSGKGKLENGESSAPGETDLVCKTVKQS